MKAVGMLSGGLDSQIAMKLIIDQGIELYAFHYCAVFCTGIPKGKCENIAVSAARRLGIPIKVVDVTLPMLEQVKKPKHGHGSGLNPCIDCRIMTFTMAKKYMEEIGAQFLVTGEVLGSRPMSQKLKTLGIIERRAGLEGYVVRPLSAKALTPSIPEQKGWVDREKFLGIDGRSRKTQFKVAEELGITEYPTPAGGCLLTEREFAKRLKRLLEENPSPEVREIDFLKYGRHFVSSQNERFIITRNGEEDARFIALLKDSDLYLRLRDVLGPTCLIVNPKADEKTIREAAEKLVRYSKVRKERGVVVTVVQGGQTREIAI